MDRGKHQVDAELRKKQAGLRPGRSCCDQTSVLRNIIGQSLEWQISLYLNFDDFEKAFDCVHQERLWKLLRLQCIPLNIINIIRVLHERFQWRVMVNNGQTEWSPVTSGLKQACMLSPLLYLVAMDWIMWESTRYQYNGSRWEIESTLDALDYDANLWLIFPLISMWKTTKIYTSRSLGLNINLKKTKIIKITRNNYSVQVNGKRFEAVDTFTYVGSMDFRRYGRVYYNNKN